MVRSLEPGEDGSNGREDGAVLHNDGADRLDDGVDGPATATSLSPTTRRRLATLRRLAIVTTVGIGLLVVAGGAVRLTGSGLGCDDWPNCNDERFVDVSSTHAAIEQLNRIFSGLIGIPTLLTAVVAFRLPRGLGVRTPALGVLITVFANAVVGGFAVRSDLHPLLIQSHFLLAMASIAFGIVVIHRAAEAGRSREILGRRIRATEPDDTGVDTTTGADRTDVVIVRLTWLLAGFTALALLSGTVVTGTGPHAGDETARRFGFDISHVARLHSIAVMASLAVALLLARRLRTHHVGDTRGTNLMSAWIFTGLVQGGIGYVQYFTGVPELLVGLHIAGATVLWILTVTVVVRIDDTVSLETSHGINNASVGAA